MHQSPMLLTNSSAPKRPTRAVSTMPSRGSAAKARAAGRASARMSLSWTEVQGHLLTLSAAAFVGAAVSEASDA
jgi:hypothetical protein